MKALIIILSALLVIYHPAGVAVVLLAETAVVAGLGWAAWRGLRGMLRPPAWRRASW